MVWAERFSRYLCIVSLLAIGLCGFPALVQAAESRHQGPSIDSSTGSSTALARQILDASGIQGGLIVHLGCGDGQLTAALHVGPQYVVHGLETDAAKVTQARQFIRTQKLYGPVSVESWAGERLPYADDFVNLIVSESAGKMPMAEITRVLVPGGVAYIKQHDQWTKTVKPWPGDIDQWTHWRHDASGNAVAHDTRVGPPQRMQWVADPPWCRGHEVITSIGALVSAHGRLIYVLDEGQTGIYVLPSRWTLVVRDAFNGMLLWKKAVSEWGPPVVLGGHTHGFQPHRLATDGGRIYLPLGEQQTLTALDAASGETVKTLEGTAGTTDVLVANGLLLAVAAPQSAAGEEKPKGRATGPTLIAVKTDTWEVLWKNHVAGLAPHTPVLAAGRVFFKASGAIVALDAQSGQEVWRTPWPESDIGKKTAGATLLAHEKTVYFTSGSELAALRADNGKVQWKTKGGAGGRGELFVADGLLWHFRGDKEIAGHDLATGETRKTIDPSSVFSQGHHLRCYPGKATDCYMITPNRGAEFVSLTSDHHTQNDWLRGSCGNGVMPANGLLYVPPSQCFCYGGVMLTGLNALAAAGSAGREAKGEEVQTPRLEQGPAYASVAQTQSPTADPADWPMYRHDAGRLGTTTSAVPASVHPLWKCALGGRLTPPVVAGGTLLLAAPDTHTVYALAASDGRQLWSYTAGGRIDSCPTLYEGRVLFGCTDGWAYCLRASDGQLAWRFRAAPEDRRVGAFGRLESAWPLHGSVLVVDGIAYFTAGRSTYLDGGIYAYGLEPKSGRVVHQARLEGAVPDGSPAGKEPSFVPAFHIEGARSDLLVSDGTSIYMGPLKLDTKLARQPTPYIVPNGDKPTTSIDLADAPYADTAVFKAGLEKKRATDFPELGVLR
jgi:outer membrane protein assembly factor BamB